MSSGRLTAHWQIAAGLWLAFLLVAWYHGAGVLTLVAAAGSVFCIARWRQWRQIWGMEREWKV